MCTTPRCSKSCSVPFPHSARSAEVGPAVVPRSYTPTAATIVSAAATPAAGVAPRPALPGAEPAREPAWAAPLGGRAHPGVVQSVPGTAGARRATRRHPRGVPHARRSPGLLELRRPFELDVCSPTPVQCGGNPAGCIRGRRSLPMRSAPPQPAASLRAEVTSGALAGLSRAGHVGGRTCCARSGFLHPAPLCAYTPCCSRVRSLPLSPALRPRARTARDPPGVPSPPSPAQRP